MGNMDNVVKGNSDLGTVISSKTRIKQRTLSSEMQPMLPCILQRT